MERLRAALQNPDASSVEQCEAVGPSIDALEVDVDAPRTAKRKLGEGDTLAATAVLKKTVNGLSKSNAQLQADIRQSQSAIALLEKKYDDECKKRQSCDSGAAEALAHHAREKTIWDQTKQQLEHGQTLHRERQQEHDALKLQYDLIQRQLSDKETAALELQLQWDNEKLLKDQLLQQYNAEKRLSKEGQEQFENDKILHGQTLQRYTYDIKQLRETYHDRDNECNRLKIDIGAERDLRQRYREQCEDLKGEIARLRMLLPDMRDTEIRSPDQNRERARVFDSRTDLIPQSSSDGHPMAMMSGAGSHTEEDVARSTKAAALGALSLPCRVIQEISTEHGLVLGGEPPQEVIDLARVVLATAQKRYPDFSPGRLLDKCKSPHRCAYSSVLRSNCFWTETNPMAYACRTCFCSRRLCFRWLQDKKTFVILPLPHPYKGYIGDSRPSDEERNAIWSQEASRGKNVLT
ncbi:Hypothetical predicted protein [Lecanosticta acicola]|uniref:Uncharacterized protein n=1 Tax=Lecanosticta acicola TaxID=111012 RepID=A0AAI8Z2U6_9PEZI|nr:Hypothetical predicted protein [Lecanosticta acicola]